MNRIRRKVSIYGILCILTIGIIFFTTSDTKGDMWLLAKEKYVVKREDLNKPISPYKIYFQTITSGGVALSDRTVMLIILKGEKIGVEECFYDEQGNDQTQRQLIPYLYEWQIRDENGKVAREWWAYFIRNRDGTYHTRVKLPKEDLERSWLVVYFEDIDGDGKREDITFGLDMSEYDWSSTPGYILQCPEPHRIWIKEKSKGSR